MVVPTELTPVLNETNNKAARIRSFAILRWLFRANACGRCKISPYVRAYLYLAECH